MAITKEQRKKVEALVYKFMEIADKSKINVEYYKKLFSKLSDKQFEDLFKKDFPLRFHYRPFENDIPFGDIVKANDSIGVPTLEKVLQPDLFKDSDGVPVATKECMVGYLPVQKMKQFITKKNSMSTDIEHRDMKTGLLLSDDKNGKTSDKEIESLIVNNLISSGLEFSKPKADGMKSKAQLYNTIKTKGMVSLEDLDIDKEDSLAKNMMFTYMIGAHIKTNLVGDGYMLPHTVKLKKQAKQL